VHMKEGKSKIRRKVKTKSGGAGRRKSFLPKGIPSSWSRVEK